METLNATLAVMVGYIWGLPMVGLLVGTGVLLSIVLKGIQFRGFSHAIKIIAGKYHNPKDPGEISHFQALCTALSATVGLGNIAGVAVAISLGGPGATFWMILTGFVGMATKFSECSISLMYRKIAPDGSVQGGAMHYIENGLGPRFKPLAIFFALACMCASFGAANMFQTQQVAAIMHTNFGIPPLIMGLLLAFLTGIVIIGGIKRIGQVTAKIIPFMAVIYVLGSLFVILTHYQEIPFLLWTIVSDAFSGTAAAGGFAGIAIREVIVQGVRRACFSNEAGLGSAPIAHAAATTNEPIRGGLVALLEPLIDTILICTMTALVILLSGAWKGEITGVELTAIAFDSALPGFGWYFIPIAVFFFAYSTLLSWSYYGEQAFLYLFGKRGLNIYKLIFCFVAVLGSVWAIEPVLNFSDMMLGLMVVPNLIAVLLLLPKLKKEVDRYFKTYS